MIKTTYAAKTSDRLRSCNNVCKHAYFIFQMILSSLLNVITVIGAAYCLLVSIQALVEGPLICNSQSNATSSCEFSLKNLTWVTVCFLTQLQLIRLECGADLLPCFLSGQSYRFSTVTPVGPISEKWRNHCIQNALGMVLAKTDYPCLSKIYGSICACI